MNLKHLASSAWQQAAAVGLHVRLSRSEAATAEVLYAGLVPSEKIKASGGAVKLAYLAARFPECGFRGNILYLVSSALPSSALAWVRVAKAKGIKIVLNQNGVAYPAWANAVNLERINKRNNEIAALSDHIIFQSEFCRRAFEKWVSGRVNSCGVLYNPVDTKLFHPVLGSRKNVDVLLMGSAAQPERIQLALSAMALAHERGFPWRACIAGKLHWPGAPEQFSQWLRDLRLEKFVEWNGAYSQKEAVSLYCGARVLLHLQDKDASPTVPLEAMACGVPVVAPRSGGLPELISEKTGILLSVSESWEKFCYPSKEEIFSALKQCIDRSSVMQAECRAHVEANFPLERFLAQHERLFSKLFSGGLP